MRCVTITLILLLSTTFGCASPRNAGERNQSTNDAAGSASLPSKSLLGVVPASFNVRDYGAAGDGQHIDTPAINLAIADACAHGGGTVAFPAGKYLCYSIRLQSNVELYLSRGCTILAADAKGEVGEPGYDAPEQNASDHYQDFGHTHFRNSLMWGDGIENVSITGPGLIWGKGLSSGFDKGLVDSKPRTDNSKKRAKAKTTTAPTTREVSDPRDTLVPTPGKWTYHLPVRNEYPNNHDALRDGVGNKSISLKNCRNITLRDFSILHGGHFGLLLTGCENLTIDNLIIDTNRDGMDIDCCRNVRVSNCSVNSPNDDGICLKSSLGLGVLKACEDVTITSCFVTGGYHEGTLINGKRERFSNRDHVGRTGRIKFGTESNGGFKRIAISNCIMEYCGGLAIESVDGAIIQDVTISNIVMRDIVFCPIFIRLGDRARGPENTQPGIIRRVNISDIVCSNANWRFGSIITGIPGYPIEDLSLSNIHIQQQGGGTANEAGIRPAELAAHYPEPDMFGTVPSSGFFIRHVNNVSLNNVDLSFFKSDDRPAFWLQDVHGIDLDHIRSTGSGSKTSPFAFVDVTNFTMHNSLSLPDASGTDPADLKP